MLVPLWITKKGMLTNFTGVHRLPHKDGTEKTGHWRGHWSTSHPVFASLYIFRSDVFFFSLCTWVCHRSKTTSLSEAENRESCLFLLFPVRCFSRALREKKPMSPLVVAPNTRTAIICDSETFQFNFIAERQKGDTDGCLVLSGLSDGHSCCGRMFSFRVTMRRRQNRGTPPVWILLGNRFNWKGKA